jgi:hypothetical protein
MSVELERTLDALQQAHAAGNTEDAAQLADYARQLQAEDAKVQEQNKALQSSLEEETQLRNPIAAAGVGAVGGELAGRALNVGMAKTPSVTVQGAGPYFSPGQKYAAKTGYGAGHGEQVREVVEEFKKREGALGKGKVTSKLSGVPMHGQAALDYAAEKEAEALRYKALREAERKALERSTSVPGKIGAAMSKATPMSLRLLGGAGSGLQLSDAYNRFKAGDYPGAAIGAIGGLGSAAALIPHPVTRIGGTIIGGGAEALNLYRDYQKENEPPQMAGGGSALAKNIGTQSAMTLPFSLSEIKNIGHALKQHKIPEAAAQMGGLSYSALAPFNPLTALISGLSYAPEVGAGSLDEYYDERVPGSVLPARLRPEEIKRYASGGNVIKKLSEILIPHESKTLLGTMADRTKATGNFQGGPGFINLHPDYTWAVDSPTVAKKHMEAVERFGGPERTVMAPMLMTTEAHKSNRPVFEKIYSDVLSKVKSGELTPEQIAAINHRIAIEKKADLSKNPGIESPDFLEFANAFNRRGALADIFGLKKLGATDLQKHLDETIDPALKEASTGAVGPQLFTMSGYENAPGIHGAYNIGFRGEKGADQFIPAEREFVFRDLEKQAREQMGRPMTDYNYRNVLKEHGGLPNQIIDEKLLRGLDELGYKKGGKVKKKKVK